MWIIEEHRWLDKTVRKLPPQVVKKYELWKSVVRYNGPQTLRGFPGFHDEALKGEWKGFRSSRLNIQYRVIYQVVEKESVVRIEEINAHKY